MTPLATIGFKADITGLKQAERGLDSLASKGEKTEKRINKSVDKTNQSFNSLRTTIGLAGAALAAVGSATLSRQLIAQSDAWKNINSQIRQVTSSEKELVGVRKELLTLSKDTRSDLTNTVDLYAQLTRSTKDLGTTQAEVFNVTKTLNNLFVAGGKPISEVSGAIRQLSQGFAAGALRGDEFNSVAEGAPKIMDALADKLKMTRGELREFAATGGITAQIMVDALKDYSDTAQKLADMTTKTFGQSMENATTNITNFVGGANSLNAAIDSLGGGIEEFTQNLDAFSNAAGVAVGVVGIGMTGAFAKSTAAKMSDVLATQSVLVANNLAAISAAKQAKSEATLAAAKVAGLKTTLAAIDGEMALEAVRLKAQISDIGRIQTSTRMAEIGVARLALNKQLVASELQLAASGNAVSVAQGKVAATAAAASISTRALGVATRFLMGPWGLLLTAVGMGAAAFISSKDSSDLLTKSLADQEGEVEKLITKYQDLTKHIGLADAERDRAEKRALSNDYIKAQQAAISIDIKRMAVQKELATAQLKIEDAFRTGQSDATIGRLSQSTENLNAELSALNLESAKQEQIMKAIGVVMDSYLPKASEMTNRTKEEAEAKKGLSKEQLTVIASFGDMVMALEVQRQQIKMTSDEFEIYSLRLDAIANDLSPAMTEALVKQAKANQLLAKSKDDEEKSVDNMKRLTDEVQNFGGAWSSTGNVIVNAFGEMSNALDDYTKRMGNLDAIQANINKQRKSDTADIIALNKMQAMVDGERVNAELAGISAIASGVGGLFKEKTAAAKAFSAIEKSITAAQLAMSLEKMISSSMETSVVVANEGVKQAALATTAVVNQGSGDPYTAFVRIAAMSALMASLVSSFSGGGGGQDATQSRQDSQGTGSVFGSDEKSNSINAAQDMFEDIQLDQLAELRGIRSSMGDLAKGITLATRTLVSGGLGEYSGDLSESSNISSGAAKALNTPMEILLGDFGGLVGKFTASLFGSVKKEVTDLGVQFVADSLGDIMESGVLAAQTFFDITKTKKKFFGLSKKESTSTELQGIDGGFEQQIGAVFASIGESVSAAADLLGFDVANALATFQVNLGKISLEGLSGKEIEEELQAVFSRQADLIAGAAIPALEKYKEIGEGSFETLMRVAKEQAVFNDTMSMIGKSFTDLSSIMQIDVAQSIIGLTGGLDKFSELTSTYFSEFFSESEQFAFLTSQLGDVFGQLGIAMPATRDEFRALIDSLDLTTEEGQATFAMLMQLVPGMAAYFDELEKANGLTAEYTSSLNEAMQALTKAVNLEKDRAGVILQAASEAHAAELTRISAQREAILAQDEAARNGLDKAIEALNRSFQAEREKIQSISDIRIAALNAELSVIQSQRDAMAASVSKSKGALDKSFDAERNAIKNKLEADKELANAALEKERDLINSKLDLEKNAIQEASNLRLQALEDEKSSISGSKSGLSSVISDMTSLASRLTTTGRETDIGSALADARKGDFSKAKNLSGDLPTSDGFSSASEFLAAQGLAENRLASIAGLATIKATEAEQQLNAINNIEAKVNAQIEAEKTNAKSLIDSLELGASESIAMLDSNASELIAKLDTDAANQLIALDAQYNALLGIDTSVLSLADAIEQYLSITEESTSLTASLDMQEALILEQIQNEQESVVAQLAALDAQYNALMGIDTSVLSLVDATLAFQEAQAQLDSLHTDEMLAKLDEELAVANAALELAQKTYDDEIARLDLILENAQAQIDVLMGIDNSVLSVVDALYNLQEVISNPPTTTEPPADGGNSVNNRELIEAQEKAQAQQAKTSTQIADSLRRQEQLLRKIELNGAPV